MTTSNEKNRNRSSSLGCKLSRFCAPFLKMQSSKIIRRIYELTVSIWFIANTRFQRYFAARLYFHSGSSRNRNLPRTASFVGSHICNDIISNLIFEIRITYLRLITIQLKLLNLLLH